ncbi:MAG: RedB protein [Archangium sp.]|nr:RedB protein [Archangium sp.]
MRLRQVARAVTGLAVGAWVMLLVLGFGLLIFHDVRPAPVVAPPATWPAETSVHRGPEFTLVMLAHPYCACMRATLDELNVLMNRTGGRVQATVLFLRPEDRPAEWSRTPIWTLATAIPGVTVREDLGGREHRLFHAGTSGELVLYDAAGKLVFSGGITASRGHSGDNLGLQRVLSLVDEGTADQRGHAVFGCSLDAPGAATVGIPVALPQRLLGDDVGARAGRALCRSCHSHAGA